MRAKVPLKMYRQINLGGVLGTYPLGLGIGHAIQGRYLSKGYIFTIGELASVAVITAGLSDCTIDLFTDNSTCNSGLISLGFGALFGFRI